MRKNRLVVLAFCFVAVISGISAGQGLCVGNDGFSNGPCCTPAQTNFPAFPPMQIGGTGACILNCSLESQYQIGVSLNPVQVLCDYWIIQLTVNAPQYAIPNQFLVAKYARTWREQLGNVNYQVWRFLVNGDLQYVTPALVGTGCPVPLSALAPYNLPVHFIGSLDYALDCASGAWSVAFNLTHLCPTDMHAPFSARPIPAATLWPKRTYHLVAPAFFNFNQLCAEPSGQIFGESVRHSRMIPGLPYTCLNEAHVMGGVLQTVTNDCACTDPTPVVPPNRNVHQTLNGTVGCQGLAVGFNSVPVAGILPTGLRGTKLGMYLPAAANVYPGNECVTVYLGVMAYGGICPSPVPITPFHIVAGVGTTGGFPAFLFDTPVAAVNANKFLDLENMLVLSNAAGGFTLGFGAVFASDVVWNLNMF